MNRALFIVLAIILCYCGDGLIAAKSLPFDARFVSPNGRYLVGFVIIDKEHHFHIRDLKTEQVDASIVMPTLLLYLRWAPNSQSFVTVEHMAGGSYGRLVYLKDGKWTSLEVGPPSNSMMNFSVVNLQMKQDRVHFRFSVDYEKGNGIPIDYEFYDLDVELVTAKVLNSTRSPINQAKWLASLKRPPSYIPAMINR